MGAAFGGYISERLRDAQESTGLMLKAALAGIAIATPAAAESAKGDG